MPNFHFLNVVGIREDDPLADPTPTLGVLSSQAPIIVDNTPLSPITLLAIKIYAFGGLAFMAAVIFTSLAYWIWVVVIKREFADSPPELDLHPERMREKEKARIARLKAQQEERDAAKKRKEEKKFAVPPLQKNRKKQQRPSSIPIKPAMQNSSLSNTTPSKNSSKSSPCSSKGKRVSWASSVSTLESDGRLYKKPLDRKRETRTSSLRPIPHFQINSPLPRARSSTPHLSTHTVDRAPRGRELIGAMSPDVVRNWAQSDQQGGKI